MFRQYTYKQSRATLAAFSAMSSLWILGIVTLALVPY